MGWLIVLVIVALVIGGIGLIVEALWWLLIVALVLFLVGAAVGWYRRGVA